MVQISPLPDAALLQTYAQRPECYSDCYSAVVPGDVSLAQFITAFYSTRLFALERFILKHAIGRPSTGVDIAALADGSAHDFAAWNVEARENDQILLCDLHARTRSWLMVENQGNSTQVFFGSAVVPREGDVKLGWVFTALLGFHKGYSRALLNSCVGRLHSSLIILD